MLPPRADPDANARMDPIPTVRATLRRTAARPPNAASDAQHCEPEERKRPDDGGSAAKPENWTRGDGNSKGLLAHLLQVAGALPRDLCQIFEVPQLVHFKKVQVVLLDVGPEQLP